MELNSNGTIKSASVREAKRVVFKRKENETLHSRLAAVRRQNNIRLGEIAVIDDREYVKVKTADFHGAGWIEVV